MTWDLFVAMLSCVATIICTVIAVLTYIKNKHE